MGGFCQILWPSHNVFILTKLFFQLEILVKFFSENLRLGNLKWRSLIVTFPDGIPEEFILKPADFSDPEFFKNLAKATLFLK